jgi:magnesium chelatase family protein
MSLAHHGVLFLDELPEFSRAVLETLRQPLEDGWISVVRASERLRFPARFTLVAAMNPCPCGHLGDPVRPCVCDPVQVGRYRARISGPLRDRMDIHLEVPALSFRELAAHGAGEPSHTVRDRVSKAREIQRRRQGRKRDRSGEPATSWNSFLGPAAVRRWCRPDPDGERLLEDASSRLGLSPRAIHRVLKLARTVADLDGSSRVREEHLAEAVQYREIGRE